MIKALLTFSITTLMTFFQHSLSSYSAFELIQFILSANNLQYMLLHLIKKKKKTRLEYRV